MAWRLAHPGQPRAARAIGARVACRVMAGPLRLEGMPQLAGGVHA